LEADINKISSLSSEIILYAQHLGTYMKENLVPEFDFDGLENQMEGKFRPGHFNGLEHIVKLFEV
jgi:pantoate--beta-alanine ligase